jgi:hypothetical protein
MEDKSVLKANLEEYTKNFKWFNKNYETLKKKYPNKIIAIDKEKIIGVSTSLKKIDKISKPTTFIGTILALEDD